MMGKIRLPYTTNKEIKGVLDALKKSGCSLAGVGSNYYPLTHKWCNSLAGGIGPNFKNGLSLIDLGCGYGRFLNHLLVKELEEFTYYGLEVPSEGNGDLLIPFNNSVYGGLNSKDRKIKFGLVNDDKLCAQAKQECDTVLLGSVFTHLCIEEAVEIVEKYREVLEKENGMIVFSVVRGEVYKLQDHKKKYKFDENFYNTKHKSYAQTCYTTKELEALSLGGRYKVSLESRCGLAKFAQEIFRITK